MKIIFEDCDLAEDLEPRSAADVTLDMIEQDKANYACAVCSEVSFQDAAGCVRVLVATREEAGHTPEPWDFHVADNADPPHVSVYAVAGGCTIATLGDRGLDSDCPLAVDMADAARICACVNFLRGVPAELLTAENSKGFLELWQRHANEGR